MRGIPRVPLFSFLDLDFFGNFEHYGTKYILTTNREKTYNAIRSFSRIFPDLPQSGDVRWYHVLGVSRYATADEMKEAARKLMLRTHPDKTRDNSLREAFRIIHEAYKDFRELKVFLKEIKEYRAYEISGLDFFFRRYKCRLVEKEMGEVPPMSRESVNELFDQDDTRELESLRLYRKRFHNLNDLTCFLTLTSAWIGIATLVYWLATKIRDANAKEPKLVKSSSLSKWKNRAIKIASISWGGLLCAVGGLCKYYEKTPDVLRRNSILGKYAEVKLRQDGITLLEFRDSSGVPRQQYVVSGSEIDAFLSTQRQNHDEYLHLCGDRMSFNQKWLRSNMKFCITLGAIFIASTFASALRKQFSSKNQESSPNKKYMKKTA